MKSTVLALEDYRRYGRQMIIPGLGLPAQLKLRHASVAVVGAGGLGCPALQYLAASGIGRIGIVDHDVVELSNLQRQIIHSEATVGMQKALSAAEFIQKLNSGVQVDVHNTAIVATNAALLLSPYDIVLDCSDNAPTRYLLSDTAVSLGKPLVSGAAQKLDGQLCTYNMDLGSGVGRGPCYRCLFPKPPAPEMTGSCEETGILGAVTGVIGTMQALEAIKIITGLHEGAPSLLIYSALGIPPFRSVRLRPRRKTCPACGDDDAKIGSISAFDYAKFCGGPRPNWEERGLENGDTPRRIRAEVLRQALLINEDTVRILDVRSRTEFGICHLPKSINVPLPELLANPSSFLEPPEGGLTAVVCRLGNDSQIAADALRDSVTVHSAGWTVVDLVGGLSSWSRDVDPQFPIY